MEDQLPTFKYNPYADAQLEPTTVTLSPQSWLDEWNQMSYLEKRVYGYLAGSTYLLAIFALIGLK